jgi:hypothetical protein
MRRFNRINAIWIIGAILVVLAGVLILGLVSLPSIEARAVSWFSPEEIEEHQPSLLDPKPVHEWYVCGDMGFGSVPGVSDQRQRVKLCHEKGWVLYTYCTQPELPVPELGTICDRVSEDMYYCGPGLQLIREYRVVDTPGPEVTPTDTQEAGITPTVTNTPFSTATSTPTPTETQIEATTPAPTETPTATITRIAQTEGAPGSPTPTRRVRPGGGGILERIGLILLIEVGILIMSALFVYLLLRRKSADRQ